MAPQPSGRIRRKNPRYFDATDAEQPARVRPIARSATGQRKRSVAAEKDVRGRAAPSRNFLGSVPNACNDELPQLCEKGGSSHDEQSLNRGCSLESIEGGIDSLLRLLSRVSKQIECAKRDTDESMDLRFNQVDRKFDTVFKAIQLLSTRLGAVRTAVGLCDQNMEKGTEEDEREYGAGEASPTRAVVTRVIPKPPPRTRNASSYVNLRSEFNAMLDKYNASVPVGRALSPISPEDIRGARVSSAAVIANYATKHW